MEDTLTCHLYIYKALIFNTDRTIEATGSDLSIGEDSDLEITATGDLNLVSGEDSIKRSFLRRLQTPSNGYSRWVLTTDGLVKVNEEYASAVYSYLASPLTQETIEFIRVAVNRAAQQDSRIVVQSVKANAVDLTTVEIQLNYYIKGETELRNLRTEFIRDV